MMPDMIVMHADDVSNSQTRGEFYGTPIREASTTAAEVREERDTRVRVRAGLDVDSVPVELLPGEVIKDNVIRRETAAEVVGEQFYAEKPQVSFEDSISGLQAPDYWDDYTARCV
jgi:hypothetical protein